MGRPKGPPVYERLMARVVIDPEGCWLWTGKVTGAGYGQIWLDGRSELVHRVAYMEHHGAIPPKMCVCHSCDNRPCVRPDHLWLGTYSENALDMHAKGRAPARPVPRRTFTVRDPEGNLITATGVGAFCHERGLSRAALVAVIAGKTLQHHGYRAVVTRPSRKGENLAAAGRARWAKYRLEHG